MKIILFAVGLALALPFAAQAATPCDDCKLLPKLEKELAEQEWLQNEFHEYALGNKGVSAGEGNPKNTAETMRAKVSAEFTKWLQSPAGGGSGGGAPALGVNFNDCTLELYVGKKTKPFNEANFRKETCKEIADFLIAHEMKHVEQCKKNRDAGSPLNPNDFRDYAALDVEAYGTGILNLRNGIAERVKKCGWQPSMNATKAAKDHDTEPTMKRAKELSKRAVSK